MGWWQATAEGQVTAGATGMIWGDEPADIMDAALDRIEATFKREWNRLPTRAELESGLKFSLPEPVTPGPTFASSI